MGYTNRCILRTEFRSTRDIFCRLLCVSAYIIVSLLAVNPANAQQAGLTFNTTLPGQNISQIATITYSRSEKITDVVLCEETCSTEFTLPDVGPGQVMDVDGAQWFFELDSEECGTDSVPDGCQNTYKVTFTSPSTQPSGSVDNKYNAELRATKTQGEGTSLAGSISLTANYNFQAAPSVVQFGSQAISGEEGTVLTIPVTRSGSAAELTGSVQARVVLLNSENASATRNQDFTWTDQTVTWRSGEQNGRTVNVELLNDTVAEDGETFFLGLEIVEGNAVFGQFPNIGVLIEEPPPAPAGIVRFTQDSATVAEDAGSVELQVERVNGSGGEISVTVSTQDSTAIAGQDYTSTLETLTWGAGESDVKTITVPIIDDETSNEGDEQFGVSIAAAAGTAAGVIGTPRVQTVTITDVEPAAVGTIRFSQATGSVDEDAGTVAVTVERVNGTAGELNIRVATRNGTALSGSDYTSVSQILNWDSGVDTAQTINIPIISDTNGEPDEQFTVVLSAEEGTPTNVFGTPRTHTITITDVEPPAIGTIRFSQAASLVDEDAGTVAVTVERVNGTAGELDIRVATRNGTAVSGSDYTSVSQVLSWDSGVGTAQTISIPIISDTNGEPDEQFTVVLSAEEGTPTNVFGTPRTHTITITDVAPPATGSIRFSQATGSVDEDAGTVAVTVQRINGTAGALTVQVATKNGTALSGSDYTSVSRELTWDSGVDTTQTVNIPIISDTTDEPAEQFIVELSAVEGTPATAIGTPATHTITITDVAPPATGNIRFSQATGSVDEDAGTVAVTVQRVNGTAGALTVRVATKNGTALSGSDYTSVSRELTWDSGVDTAQTINIPITSDAISESIEQFIVELSAVEGTPANAIGSPRAHTITITDIEPPATGAIQFSKSSESVTENAGAVLVSMQRVGGSAGAITVTVATQDDTATAGADYVGVSQTFTWAAGESTAKHSR